MGAAAGCESCSKAHEGDDGRDIIEPGAAQEDDGKNNDTTNERKSSKEESKGGDDSGVITKVFPDGSKYVGGIENCLKHGKGKFDYPDGDWYEGEWIDGRAHGKGYLFCKLSQYDGEWHQDLKHGHAVEIWEDLSKYIGSYFNGQKHGIGKFMWPDGGIYEGEFHNNNVDGEGVFKTEDGRRYIGQWCDGRMHGTGRYEWPDEAGEMIRTYEGHYVNDLREGEGTFCWNDGRKYQGQWKDGKQHGLGIFITATKQETTGKKESAIKEERSGEWRNGVRIAFHENHTKKDSGSEDEMDEDKQLADADQMDNPETVS